MRKNTTRRGKIPPYQRFSTSNFDKLYDNSNLLNNLTLTINNIPKIPLWCYRGQDATFSAGSSSCSWVGYSGYGATIDTYNSGGTGNEATGSQITPFDTSTGLMLGSVDKGFSLSSGTLNHPDQNSEYQDFVYEIIFKASNSATELFGIYGTNGYYLWVNTGWGIQLTLKNGSTILQVSSQNDSIYKNSWNHVMVFGDRSGNCSIFLNGVHIGTTSISSFSTLSLYDASAQFKIGLNNLIQSNFVLCHAAAWYQTNWLDTSDQYTIVKNRTAKLFNLELNDSRSSIYPITTQTNASPIYNERFDNSGTNKYLFKMGKFAPRISNKKDLNSKSVRGLTTLDGKTNLIPNAETYSAWTLSGVTIASGVSISPDPYLTFDAIAEDGNNSIHAMGLPNIIITTSGVDHTFSTFCEKSNRDIVALHVASSTSPSPTTWFNLTTGTVGASTNAKKNLIESYGNNKYRVSTTWNEANPGLITPIIYSCSTDGSLSYQGASQNSLNIWAPQIEPDSNPSELILTSGSSITLAGDSSVSYVASGGNIGYMRETSDYVIGCDISSTISGEISNLVKVSKEGNNYNQAKLYIDAAGQPCLSVSNRPTTLSVTDFYSTTCSGCTVSGLATSGPDGLTNAFVFTEDGTTGLHSLYGTGSASTGEKEISCYFKYINRKYVKLEVYDNSGGTTFDSIIVDLQNKQYSSSSTSSPSRIIDYGVDKYSDDWVRTWFRTEKNAVQYRIWAIADNATTLSFAGNNSPSFYFTKLTTTLKQPNLLSLNNDITGYTKGNCTVSGNVIVDPMGTQLADAVYENDTAAGSAHYVRGDNDLYTLTANKKYKASGFFKAGNRTWVYPVFRSVSGWYFASAYIDLSTGVLGTVTNGTTYSYNHKYNIYDYGNGWYKVEYIFTALADLTNARWYILIGEADNDYNFDGLGQLSFYVYGLRLEEYPSEIEITASPTNLLDNNYSFITSYWTKTRCSITGQAIADPFGGMNGEALNEGSSSSTTRYLSRTSSYTITAGTSAVFGCYIKPVNRTWANLRFLITSGTNRYCCFNLSGAGATGTNTGLSNYGISYLGNNWYICWISATFTISGNLERYIYVSEGNNDETFSGLNQVAFYICEPFLETGVTTPSRWNLYDGNIRNIKGTWNNSSVGLIVDNVSQLVSSYLYDNTFIPRTLNRLDIGSKALSAKTSADCIIESRERVKSVSCDVLLPEQSGGKVQKLLTLSDRGCQNRKVDISVDGAGRPKLTFANNNYDFSDLSISVIGCTATTNNSTGPFSENNATLIHEDSSTGSHYFYKTYADKMQDKEFSVYVKSITRRYIKFYLLSGSINAGFVVDIINGKITTTSKSVTSVDLLPEYGIIPFQNSWFKIWLKTPFVTNGSIIGLIIADDGITTSFTGENKDSFYIYNIEEIMYGKRNLLTVTNDITGYTLTNCTINANSITDPMGTSLADLIYEDSTNGVHRIQSLNDLFNLAANKKYKLSGFIKAANRNWIIFQFYYSAAYYTQYYFDTNLTNSTFGPSTCFSGSNTTIYKIYAEKYDNNWYKLSIIFSVDSNVTGAHIRHALFDGSTGSFQGLNQGSLYVYGTKLEEYPHEIEIITSSINLIDNNYNFASNYWTKQSCYITGISQLDPFGTYTAEVLNEDLGSNTTHYIYNTISRTTSVGELYTASVFIKAIGKNWFRLALYSSGGGILHYVYFNLNNGTTGTALNLTSYNIHYINNGWYLCWISWIHDITKTSLTFELGIAEADMDIIFSGVGTNVFYICEPFLETGVTTPSRFNLYDGKIHKVHASWENNYATIGIDNNWTSSPSTTIISSTDIPGNLSRIEVGRGTISNVKTFNKTHGRK